MSRAEELPDFYTLLQRRLHWLVLILLAGQYLLQGFMRDTLTTLEAGESISFWQFSVSTLHTWGGLTIAVLMLWRWRLRRRKVPLNGGHLSHKLQRLVLVHHASLYVATIIMAATGAMHYYLGWQFAQRWHELGKWILLALVVVHVAGALWHARLDSLVLHRMMGKNSLH